MLTFIEGHRYPFPDWDLEHKELSVRENEGVNGNEYWNARCLEWLNSLAQALGKGYRVLRVGSFVLLTAQDERVIARISAWSEAARNKILGTLGELVQPPAGLIPILVLKDIDQYYSYICDYLPDGNHGLSGGMYVSSGYGHFVFAFSNLASAESVIVHELSHVLVGSLRIPLWLNEGIAQMFEAGILGRLTIDFEQVKETISGYWDHEKIREFWSGKSFNRQDEGQVQSYHLAFVLTRKLVTDMNRFRNFVREATESDGGESSLRKYFGFGLSELVEDYLGEGKWSCRQVKFF